MSKQNQKIFLALLLLIGAVFCVFSAPQILEFVTPRTVPVEMMPTPDPLEAKLNDLASRYKNGEVPVIDLSTITTFSWDRLYIFGDYTGFSELFPVVGAYWLNNDCSYVVNLINYSDSYTLLVFSNKGTVVHCLAHAKGPYYLFVPNQGFDKAGYSPQEALFVLSDTGRMVLKQNK
jgi:hypothetical protein